MHSRVLWLMLLATCLSAQASQDRLQGDWQVVWSCKGAIGSFADRCAEGDRDYFKLSLVVRDNHICGLHTATAHLGNRVDEGDLLDGKPTIEGVTSGLTANVNFRSAWGATGVAKIDLAAGKLHWHVITQSEGDSWIPKDAVLIKQSESGSDAKNVCFK